MSSKDNPISFRLAINKNWASRWFAKSKKTYREQLKEDSFFRNFIKKRLKTGGISKIVISRLSASIIFDVYAARPGMIIGRGGSGIEELKEIIKKRLISKIDVKINIHEIEKPELNATLVAENIAEAIEKRIPFRRVMKQALEKVVQRGAKGVKIALRGRLDGADIARKEWIKKGRLPLQTLRADIDYGEKTAFTTYGTIGIKVWIYRGEFLSEEIKENNKRI